MAKLVQVSGSLTSQPDSCASGVGQLTRILGLGSSCSGNCNGGTYYQAVISACIDLATAGVVGSNFDDLECTDELSVIELLYLRTSAEVIARIDAVAAVGVGVGGTYPTGFIGGETLITTFDGTAVTTTFNAGDQLLTDVISRINAAFALANYPTPRASENSGELQITGIATKRTGLEGTLAFSGAGGDTVLGMDNAVITDAQGQDIAINGLSLIQFPKTGSNAPTKIQLSGVATVDVVAAGQA